MHVLLSRRQAVLSSYISSVLTVQRASALSKTAKKTSLGGPKQYVFVDPGIMNFMPPPMGCLNLVSKALKSEALLALHKASNITNLLESSFSTNSAVGGPDRMCLTTNDTSHTSWYLRAGGRWLNIPCTRRQTIGCCPIGFPSIACSVADRADRYELSVVCCLPSWNCSLNTGPTDGGKGSVLVRLHQSIHFPQAEE